MSIASAPDEWEKPTKRVELHLMPQLHLIWTDTYLFYHSYSLILSIYSFMNTFTLCGRMYQYWAFCHYYIYAHYLTHTLSVCTFIHLFIHHVQVLCKPCYIQDELCIYVTQINYNLHIPPLPSCFI